MAERTVSKEGFGLMVAVTTVVLGFLVVFATKRFVSPVEESIVIALMTLPLLAYLISSGRLAEFKGPGGLEAKFVQAAGESVSPASETVAYDDPQVVAKASVRELVDRKAHDIDESQPIIMTMTVGGAAKYVPGDVDRYLQVLSQFRNFKFVVFIDRDGRFVAYMPSWALRQLMQAPELGDEFVNSVNHGLTTQMLRYPGVVRKTISTVSTNAQALSEMLAQNIEALVVIDEQRKIRGVVERDQVLSRMMLSLVR